VNAPAKAVRARFVAELGFELDPFQIGAFDALDEGASVLVAAPTGSGKTLVAEYAVAQTLNVGRRTYYTTPLKALSNQKYGDFVSTYGSDRVGLLTGDVSQNPGGDIVVMTTEVLRNMIYSQPGRLSELGCVVLDEVHYLEDRYRGSVWEEIILSAPKDVALVCLSATVANAEELAAWMTGVRGEVTPIIEDRRPIELRQLYVVEDRREGELAVLPTFVNGQPNRRALELDGKREQRMHSRRSPAGSKPVRGSLRPRRSEVVEDFGRAELLPAIYFVFSRNGCEEAVRQCTDTGIRLTTAEERAEIREITDRHVEALSDADLKLLNYTRFRSAAEAGIAAHHAGLVPAFREAVEELFSKALVKVVFATETLALGINMPARSVIIEALSKFGGDGHEDLTPGEYTQLTGRAGRRGIDDVGYAAVLFSPYHSFEDVAALAASRTGPLTSSFRPTANMAVNLVRRHRKEDAYRLVRSSFAQYQSRTPLTDELDDILQLLEERDYVEGWRLTSAGERLCGIYHDCDLLVAEAIGTGLLDGLDAPELAAIASMFTYESRRGQTRRDLPSARLTRRAGELMGLAAELRKTERRHGLPQTRALDPGFGALAYAWARGEDLTTILKQARGAQRRHGESDLVMSGGDFVRNVKQLADLIRQISAVAGASRLERAARSAEGALIRGIVALTNLPEIDEGLDREDPSATIEGEETGDAALPVPSS
jgi:superfamily II RNA helicase